MHGRFDDATVQTLLKIEWGDWDIDKITRNLSLISSSDRAALEKAA